MAQLSGWVGNEEGDKSDERCNKTNFIVVISVIGKGHQKTFFTIHLQLSVSSCYQLGEKVMGVLTHLKSRVTEPLQQNSSQVTRISPEIPESGDFRLKVLKS